MEVKRRAKKKKVLIYKPPFLEEKYYTTRSKLWLDLGKLLIAENALEHLRIFCYDVHQYLFFAKDGKDFVSKFITASLSACKYDCLPILLAFATPHWTEMRISEVS